LSAAGKPFSLMPDQVEITIALDEEESIREFVDIPVQAKDFAGVYTVTPPMVSLRLSGAKSLVDKLELKGDEVYLNLNDLPIGEHDLPLMIKLPAGIRMLEQTPPRFRVRIGNPTDLD